MKNCVIYILKVPFTIHMTVCFLFISLGNYMVMRKCANILNAIKKIKKKSND